ncbi:MAG: tetratricopeptide repeat protein [Longimicrobiales bacterium]
MSRERWQRIDDLFAAALEIEPASRDAWLERECAGDDDLLAHVRRLLRRTSEAEAVLGDSVTGYASDILESLGGDALADDALAAGTRIGPYRLIREVGRGGMGTVYLAERADAEFEKRVALKVVRRGMDTEDVLLRFRFERQILASLEHPSIARLYDGGAAPDGRPYLVMEYIEGEPITRYADALGLGIEERLRLFGQVCDAVAFAHRSLVVHRDIKPSNILIDAAGSPKLLDFGIARLLDPSAPDTGPVTRTGLCLLTPEYSSPEQRRGQPVTTATDVYSLGLVLYELLTGTRPDPGRPRRPSTVASHHAWRRRLQGDLDTIILRALADDPERRYASADQLGDDIDRHLQQLPVHARGDSVRYRAGRFVRRHRGFVAAAALIVLSLVSGLGVAVWQADQAARERDQANRERARAEQVSGFVLGLFGSSDPLQPEGGDTLRVRAVVEHGAERVRAELAGQPQLQAQMLTMLGRVFRNLGQYSRAEELIGEALVLAGNDPLHARERVEATAALADLALRRREYARLDSLAAGVVSSYDNAGWPVDATYINSVSLLAIARDGVGDYGEARPHHERALELATALGDTAINTRASMLNNYAVHLYELGEYAQAEPLMRESLELARSIYGPRHVGLVSDLNNLASAIHYQGRHDEAEPVYREAIEIARDAYGRDHPYVAQFQENLATLYADMGRYEDAAPLYREALRVAMLEPEGLRLANLRRNYALNLHATGQLAEAETMLRASLAGFQNELGDDHLYPALARTSLGRTLTEAGRPADALPLLQRALAVIEREFPPDHWRVHHVRGELGHALARLGDHAAAEPMLLESHATLAAARGENDHLTRDMRIYLHRLYTELRRVDEAAAFAPDVR